MSRTCPLAVVLSLCLSPVSAQEPAAGPHMIYSNDTTHILSNVSPYHADKEARFTDEMIRASVREAAVPGMDAQMIQAGTYWVPWWPSQIYSLSEHLRWYEGRYGKQDYPVHDYLLNGGDLIGTFLDECHRQGMGGWVSFRVNDLHLLENYDKKRPPYPSVYALSKFYVDNPQLRLGPRPPRPAQQGRGQNWLMPESRAYKLALIEEILTRYPVDGLELDFERYPNYFPPDTPMARRVEIMTGFIRDVRRLLDQTAPEEGRHRPLMVRVPARSIEMEKIRTDPVNWEKVGFEPAAWREAGVDIFNLSPFYRTTQQTDIAAVRQAAPDARVLLELTHTPQTWHLTFEANDGFGHRRSTREMLDTTARLAYARGADGVTIFNFPYYREYGPIRDQRGPFNEPPFEYLPALADRQKLEDAGPAYFYRALKGPATPGQSWEYTLDMLPFPDGGEGLLRLQVLTDKELASGGDRPVSPGANRGQWTVRVNGHQLEPAKALPTAYPFPVPFQAGFGQPDQYLAWKLPLNLVRDGLNTVALTYDKGPPLHLRWLEVTERPAGRP